MPRTGAAARGGEPRPAPLTLNIVFKIVLAFSGPLQAPPSPAAACRALCELQVHAGFFGFQGVETLKPSVHRRCCWVFRVLQPLKPLKLKKLECTAGAPARGARAQAHAAGDGGRGHAHERGGAARALVLRQQVGAFVAGAFVAGAFVAGAFVVGAFVV